MRALGWGVGAGAWGLGLKERHCPSLYLAMKPVFDGRVVMDRLGWIRGFLFMGGQALGFGNELGAQAGGRVQLAGCRLFFFLRSVCFGGLHWSRRRRKV